MILLSFSQATQVSAETCCLFLELLCLCICKDASSLPAGLSLNITSYRGFLSTSLP